MRMHAKAVGIVWWDDGFAPLMSYPAHNETLLKPVVRQDDHR